MERIFNFIENYVLEILLVFCTCVLIALYCGSWILWQDNSIRALSALALIALQLIVACCLPLFSKEQLLEHYSQIFVICCLSSLVIMWGLALIMKIDYCFLFLVMVTILTIIIILGGILIISGIEILKMQRRTFNEIFFPH